jgi:hypothetical protein
MAPAASFILPLAFSDIVGLLWLACPLVSS